MSKKVKKIILSDEEVELLETGNVNVDFSLAFQEDLK